MADTLIQVIDVETTSKAKDKPFAATPHHPDNEIVLFGMMQRGVTTPCIFEKSEMDGWKYTPIDPKDEGNTVMFVGQNLKFDVTHTCKKLGVAPRHFLQNTVLWDVGVGHYLQRCMRVTSPSLDEISEYHLLPTKPPAISDKFKEGLGADDIIALGPMWETQLREYLKHDLSTTMTIFENQAVELNMIGLSRVMQSQMMAYKAYIEMEYNGLAIDKMKLAEIESTCISRRDSAASTASLLLGAAWPTTEAGVFTPSRAAHLELALFGGEVKYEDRESWGTYKNGKPKTRKVTKSRLYKGFGLSPTEYTVRTPAGKQWEITDTVLQNIGTSRKLGADVRAFATAVLEFRRNSKITNTYAKNLWVNLYPDGLIHHSINPTVTNTGRTSSSNPNVQNQDEAVKPAFVSRWGEDGRLVEVDWSQLEVIGLAVRTGCPDLRRDLMDGTDIHTALYFDMYARHPTKAERKAFKPLTFGLIYGAGATTLAENAGIPRHEADRFIQTFYRRYPAVKEWHSEMLKNAKLSRLPSAHRTKMGLPAGLYRYICPLTGRIYLFIETDGYTPGHPSFSPTELKNYPIQGLSTGDWHPFATGTLALKLWSNTSLKDHALLVNTVHDSLLFDVHIDHLSEFMEFLDKVYKDMYKDWEAHFGTKWPIPVKYEAKTGLNWGAMTEWTFI